MREERDCTKKGRDCTNRGRMLTRGGKARRRVCLDSSSRSSRLDGLRRSRSSRSSRVKAIGLDRSGKVHPQHRSGVVLLSRGMRSLVATTAPQPRLTTPVVGFLSRRVDNPPLRTSTVCRTRHHSPRLIMGRPPRLVGLLVWFLLKTGNRAVRRVPRLVWFLVGFLLVAAGKGGFRRPTPKASSSRYSLRTGRCMGPEASRWVCPPTTSTTRAALAPRPACRVARRQ